MISIQKIVNLELCPPCFLIKENRHWSIEPVSFWISLGANIVLTMKYCGPQLFILMKTADQTHKCVSSALPTYSQFCLNWEIKQARSSISHI